MPKSSAGPTGPDTSRLNPTPTSASGPAVVGEMARRVVPLAPVTLSIAAPPAVAEVPILV